MSSKNSLARIKVFSPVLFISLAVFLFISGFLKAQEEGAEVEEAEPPAPASTPAAKAPSVIATTDGEYADVRVDVKELKRTSGGTLTLKFALINDSDEDLDFGYDFGEGTGDFNTVGAVHLIDAAGKKKYLVLRDTEGKCVCSSGMKSVQPGTSINLYAKFPAPPEDVEKITIIIPHFIPMDDVPISK